MGNQFGSFYCELAPVLSKSVTLLWVNENLMFSNILYSSGLRVLVYSEPAKAQG